MNQAPTQDKSTPASNIYNGFGNTSLATLHFAIILR